MEERYNKSTKTFRFDPELDEYDKQCTVKDQQNTINSSEKIKV
ncbi:hypothetical protein BSPWISOXPB_1396 [uncultured Gammaproteobacteria bacterium]|nr:hypothetical protein BSPWISOXPB_1396 [uncultured Gammaproteobacteria bacterium]